MINVEELPKVRGAYRQNADLAKTTWFATGGLAEILFRPEDAEDLSQFIQQLPREVPYKVIGVGSNLLVRDGGLSGVVIRLGRAFTEMRVEANELYAGAAVSDLNLANFAMSNGLGGAEFLVGVPGLIGGGVFMNCGCYGGEIAQIISYIMVIDERGDVKKISRDEIDFQYRTSNLPNNWIIIGAGFNLTPESPEVIKAKMDEISKQRQLAQPIKEKTGGSTFKNPEGYRAWELIDKVGLRGHKLGGAMVSPLHCNFLINLGNAKSADIENLGELIRAKVKDKFDVDLEWEIKIIGNK